MAAPAAAIGRAVAPAATGSAAAATAVMVASGNCSVLNCLVVGCERVGIILGQARPAAGQLPSSASPKTLHAS
jgi:hypothetical protein